MKRKPRIAPKRTPLIYAEPRVVIEDLVEMYIQHQADAYEVVKVDRPKSGLSAARQSFIKYRSGI